MSKKKTRNTKAKIVSAAWKLFYEQGYEATTVEEIIEESGTSRGSFYHYFDGKDALLSSLSFLFDEEYEALREEIGEEDDPFETLMFLNRRLFQMIENRVSLDLMSRLYSTQLVTKGQRHLQDHAPPGHRRPRPGTGRSPLGLDRQRDRQALRPGGTGPDLRLVPLQRRLFPQRLRRQGLSPDDGADPQAGGGK